MFVAYLRTFARMGLKSIPMAADTGPIGGDLSHEFIILAETGESRVFCHADLLETRAPAADIDFERRPRPRSSSSGPAPTRRPTRSTMPARFEAEVPADKRVSARGIEVGHIFFFGTKYSEPMGCRVQGPDGSMIAVQMGSYGVGVSRLAGAIIEASHDEAGIVWPVPVAPFEVGLDQSQGGRQGYRRGVRRSLRQARAGRHLRALRRHGGARRRQVRDHGPDRPAVPADRRARRA